GKSGVYGFSTAGNGVSGRTQGDGYGGHFTAEGASGTAVYASAPGGGLAGDFTGDVNINSGGLNVSDNGTAGDFYSSEFSASDSGVIYARYDGSVFSSFLPSAISGFSLPSEGYGGVGGYFQANGVGVLAEVYRGTIDADAVGFMALVSHGGPNVTNTGFDANINGSNVRANIGLNVDASGADGENYGAIIRAEDAMGLTHALRNTGTYTVSYYGDTCTALHAYANSGDSASIGVRSEAYWGTTTYGGHFYAHSAGDNYGLYAESMLGEKNYGIYAKAPTGLLDYAGYFDGDVKVTGGLWATAKYFQIDHPLDPANKYLNHACVESADMMNIYNGNVTTDDDGFIKVTLPEYVTALNTDFRYQLTVIGQFAQAIIAEEISGNEFTIRTDKPGVKVSWQITGIRNDAAARFNRQPVEMDKPDSEKGTYQNPKAFGMGEEFGVHYQMQKKARLSNGEDAVQYQSAVERRQTDQSRRP
ncbi:MAG: hypothetical protein GY841_23915, partial [FCB group bacterium]|nr:hypothetical protein [FCB group bacterium]